jgi:hypothetical protein
VIERFSGEDGQRLLLEALLRQELILGDVDIALALINSGKLTSVGPKVSLISQDDTDNSIFLLFLESFQFKSTDDK